MADSPAAVLFGECIGFWTDITADSADAGNQPDMGTLEGTITLEAVDINFMKFATTTPKMSALLRPVVLQVVAGYLRGPAGGTQQAFVMATTQPAGNPSSFYWKATFNFTGVSPQPAPVFFQLPSGGVVDLSQQMSASPQPGESYVLQTSGQFVKTINGVSPDGAGNVVVSGSGTAESVTPTGGTLAKRDAEGQMQAADPVAAQDVVTKAYQEATVGASVVTLGGNMDNLFGRVNGHDTDIASLDGRVDALEASTPIAGSAATVAAIPGGAAVGTLWVITT